MHTSTNFSEKFTNMFGEHRRIPTLVCTRWNSMFKQIASVTALDHLKLSTVCSNANCMELDFSPREWLQLEEFVELLHPFYEATMLTQGEDAPTISLVLPTVLSLKKHLVEFIKKKSKHLKFMAEQIFQSMATRFSGIFKNVETRFSALRSSDTWFVDEPFGDTIYVVAATLNPMFGLEWVKETRTSDKEKESLTSSVKGKLYFIFIF